MHFLTHHDYLYTNTWRQRTFENTSMYTRTNVSVYSIEFNIKYINLKWLRAIRILYIVRVHTFTFPTYIKPLVKTSSVSGLWGIVNRSLLCIYSSFMKV